MTENEREELEKADLLAEVASVGHRVGPKGCQGCYADVDCRIDICVQGESVYLCIDCATAVKDDLSKLLDYIKSKK